VDGPLADRLNAVESCVALLARLEARRDVDRRRKLQALRQIGVYLAVVLHENDRAVIGAKRRPDVKRSRALRTGEQPVRDRASRYLSAQAIPLSCRSGSSGLVAHGDSPSYAFIGTTMTVALVKRTPLIPSKWKVTPHDA
jgi:hypothetical protein